MWKYVVVASVVAALAALWLLSPIFDKHEGTAAWVQAFGSVVAILAAAWIANRESRENRKREAEKRRQLWESIATISENSIAAFTKLNNACTQPGSQRENFLIHYAPSDFDVPIDGLATIPLHEIGDANLITFVVNLRGIMGNIQKKLDNLHRNLGDPLYIFDLEFLNNQKTSIFNAHANIWRTVHPNRENDLRKFA